MICLFFALRFGLNILLNFMNSILYVMRMGSLKCKNTKDSSWGSPGLEFPCWPVWLMWSIYSLTDDLLVVEMVFHSLSPSFSPSRQPSIWPSGHRGLTNIQSCTGWNKDETAASRTKDSERASVRVCKKENVYFYVLEEEDKNTYRGECGCENESCLSSLTMYLERAHRCLRLDI